ncbi:hypothetical protein Mgra_00009080 [Meloidogyne graminicola]|uniref:Gamma-glutamyl transpeptidase n=1 Tax=Meloidogyne graminicola TaxID=189291 RepID=A0A8S9ZE34_9BILA|nr:hypothetical protein Mgra_00009080 [Meloidogyne graminicola]
MLLFASTFIIAYLFMSFDLLGNNLFLFLIISHFVGKVQISSMEPSICSSAASTAEAFSCGYELTPPLNYHSPKESKPHFYNKQTNGTRTNSKSNLKASHFCRLLINLVAGAAIMLTILAGILLFVVMPQISRSNHEQRQRRFPGNQEHRYDWPPPSYSLMGRFKNAAITCDHGICSEIGRDIMISGGNAIDSAIASLFCLGVTNPQSSGLGGGFILTFYDRANQKCLVLDARETAPSASNRSMFGKDEWASKYVQICGTLGFLAIATPGELAGYWRAYKEWGSGKIMPSVNLARKGVPISEYLAHVLNIKEAHLKKLPSMKSWLNPKTQKVWQFGDVIKRPELADTMERLAKEKNPMELFYRGEMAEQIVKEINDNGGILTREDLASYRVIIHESPLLVDGFSGNLKMCGPPPPSSFAVTQAIVAAMTSKFSNYTRWGNPINGVLDDTEFYHWLIETQKFAYAQRTRLGDIRFVPEAKNLAKNMTDKRFAKLLLKRVPPKAMFSSYYSDIPISAQKTMALHMFLYLIQMEMEFLQPVLFGAVVQSEKLGIVWNDEMDDFSSPGMSNGFGFAPSEANFIEPEKRPMSSMSPMVIFDGETGNLKFVIGASGGSKIISAMAKPIIRVLCFNETIKEAIDSPTLHNQFTPDVTQYEETVPKQLIHDLESKFGQKFKLTTGFEGIVQAILVGDDGFIYANGDYRRRTNMHPEGF